MRQIVDVRMPRFPECWESCGNCGSGVDLGWVYTMRPPRGQTWRRDDWKTTVKPLYDRNFGEVKVQWDAALAAGQIGLDAYQEHFMDEVWRRVAMDSGIRYRRKGRRP